MMSDDDHNLEARKAGLCVEIVGCVWETTLVHVAAIFCSEIDVSLIVEPIVHFCWFL